MREPEAYLGRPVYSLQTMLRQIADSDSWVLPVVPDGRYGRNTYASVRSFQQAYGLPPTGSVDLPTWNAIVAAHNEVLPELIAPVIRPLWISGKSVLPGQCNIHLYLVQGLLTALSKLYPEITAPQMTGCLDMETEANLRWVQKIAGLPETGILNTATWHALDGLYRVAVGEG